MGPVLKTVFSVGYWYCKSAKKKLHSIKFIKLGRKYFKVPRRTEKYLEVPKRYIEVHRSAYK